VTTANILDAEFNHRDGLGAFIEASGGSLWVFSIDPATGLLTPSDGRGTLVDTLGAYAGDFGNGPEWAFGGSQDAQLVYTKYAGPPDPTTARNARAIQVGGRWCPAFMDTTLPACIQIASPTGRPSPGGDLSPRMHWSPPTGTSPPPGSYWRPLDAPGYVRMIPGTEGSVGGTTRRSIDGNHKIIWGQSAADGGNVFTYDTDTNVTEQLTFISGGQFVDDAFMWPAPELSNEYVFFATVNTGSGHNLNVYRKLSGTWTIVNTITSPFIITKPYIWSPEPFTRSGHSYIFCQMSGAPGGAFVPVNTAIGVADALTAATMTVISDGTANFRQDPEYYPYGPGGTAKIWYNRYDVGGSPSQGIYFADTGIT